MTSSNQQARDELATTIDTYFVPYGRDVMLGPSGSGILADLVGASGQESAEVAALRSVHAAISGNVPVSSTGWDALISQSPGDHETAQWAVRLWQQRFDPQSMPQPPAPSPPMPQPPAPQAAVPPAGPTPAGPTPVAPGPVLGGSVDDFPTDVPTPSPGPVLSGSIDDIATDVRTPGPVLAGGVDEADTEVHARSRPSPSPSPAPPPPPRRREGGWAKIVAALAVVGALGFALAWFLLRPESAPVVLAEPTPTAVAAESVPTPTAEAPPSTAPSTVPTPPPTIAPAIDVTCNVSAMQVQVQEEFIVEAQVSPPDPNAVLLFDHGDGATWDEAPHVAFYFYPDVFDITLEWASQGQRGVAACGRVEVSGTPVGYRECDPGRAPNPNSLYRVDVPNDPTDPENGLVVRVGPGVDKPLRGILEPDERNVRLTGCWQPTSGLNPWWQVNGGGWSSSCCLREQ